MNTIRGILSWWWQTFRGRGAIGKAVFGILSLVLLCLLVAIPVSIISPPSATKVPPAPTREEAKPTSEKVAEATSTPEPTQIEPTATVEPIEAPATPATSETPMPVPTEAPLPTLTKEVSDLSFEEIVETFEEYMKEARAGGTPAFGPAPGWETYREDVIGQRVQWSGWYIHTVNERTYYRAIIHMSSPEGNDPYVNLMLAQEPGDEFERLQEIVFQGDVTDVKTAMMTFDSVYLDNVVFLQ